MTGKAATMIRNRTAGPHCSFGVETLALVSLLVVLASAWRVSAQPPPGTPVANPASTPAAGDAAAARRSEAEQIMQVQRLLESDEAWGATLLEELKRTEAEFSASLRTFADLDQKLQAETQSATTDEAVSTAEEVAALASQRDVSRDRLDRLIEQRRALRQQLETLEQKVALEARILADLMAGRSPSLDPLEGSVAESVGAKLERPSVPRPLGTGAQSPPTTAAGGHRESETTLKLEDDAEMRVVDSSVASARNSLARHESQVRVATAGLALVDRAIEVFEKDLESAKQLRTAATSDETSAADSLRAASGALRKAKSASEAADSTIGEHEAAVASARQRLKRAQEAVARHVERIEGSESSMLALQKARGEAVFAAETAQAALTLAKRRLAFVNSALAPHRLVKWLFERGPRIAIVVATFFGLWLFGRFLTRRVIAALVLRGKRGSETAREERAETLRRVFESATAITLLILGVLATLQQAGFDVKVLLGGAAVFGAALALGSQNLIKHYVSGLTVLIENQYSVGNVIKLGGTSGVVEDITLRMTVLRDLEGIVHFIPHDSQGCVSNMTYGWSRALFDIGVSYREDVNKVMEVLMDLAHELRGDETFGPYMLGEPEMLGVDSFGDSAVSIKFFIKTRPLRQWLVKREMLRRIKLRFDKVGIEIPFPHRTLYHRGLATTTPTGPA